MKRYVRSGLVLLIATAGLAQAQTVIYVDQNADQEPHDGSSWCRAYLELSEVLPAGSDTVVRVANGTYLPDPTGLGDPREATFQLANGVTIQGGYAGCNDGGDLRDVALYQTILSGDLNGDDQPDWGNRTDNSYHVVTGSGTDTTAVLDGFTITGGYANGAWPHTMGGGMRNYGAGGSPTVTNCTFLGNSATDNGGGMHNSSGSSPTLTSCQFINNEGGIRGGGLRNNNTSNPMLTNCTFYGNTAESGAGMFNDYESNPILSHCTFIGNSATITGGAMRNGYNSHPTLNHCTFIGNSAVSGGGMYNHQSSGPTLTNCTFSGNTASSGGAGGGVVNDHDCIATLANCVFVGNSAPWAGGVCNWHNSTITLANCTFAGNLATTGNGAAIGCDSVSHESPGIVIAANCIMWDGGNELWNADGSAITVSYSCIQGCYDGTGNMDADPRFVDGAGPDGLFGTDDDDLRLRLVSPCVDVGDNSAVPPGISTDRTGNPRFVDAPQTPDTGQGTPPLVDMGAYEFQPAAMADFDGDGDVDMDDCAFFQQQFTGPLP